MHLHLATIVVILRHELSNRADVCYEFAEMSRVKMIVLRIQSPEGTKRVEIKSSDATSALFTKVNETFELSSFNFALFKDRNHKEEIVSNNSKPVSSYCLQHGDMLYLTPLNGTMLFDQPTTSSQKVISSGEANKTDIIPGFSSLSSSSAPQEDEVDIQLYKLDGKIARKRDEKYCRHNSNGCCVHCSPLEPFDESNLREQNVKHMSFHTYIRKLTSGVDRGKFLALEDISCRIKVGCKEHPPWPRGICSKCQPSAVTLSGQVYRHVDNVMFENTDIVERFLEFWRTTAHQRIGLLYGNYEIHSDVPLGIRARVAAIYEPPQVSSRDSVTLLPDEHQMVVDELANQLGLVQVGWIFTDLLSEDSSKGTVQHIRGIDSHFMTAQECIMAGRFQNQHPNACKFASSGYFGSKYVTVCVTGDVSKQVHMEGYQVTNQCMAMVRDDCLLPTKDAPELGYIRESSDKQYVPDVYYKEKDQYNNEVARSARPLPVEYLLVQVPCAASRTPLSTFRRRGERPGMASDTSFPVENRAPPDQHLTALAHYLPHFAGDDFLEAMSDFHVLIYIASMEALPMFPHMGELLEAVKTGDSELAARWRCSEHWATVEQLIAASEHQTHQSSDMGMGGMASGGIEEGPMWTCPHCTYHNPSHRDACEICMLPR